MKLFFLDVHRPFKATSEGRLVLILQSHADDRFARTKVGFKQDVSMEILTDENLLRVL